MKNIILIILIGCMGYAEDNNGLSPISQEAESGKSVYIPPPKPIEIAEERGIQKEDQNMTGHGAANGN